jgi:hypothetical protein
VQIEAGLYGGFQPLEELQELAVAMPRHALVDDLAGGDVQRSEESACIWLFSSNEKTTAWVGGSR